ncbi:MAG: ester cyclase [Pseudomonadota bacterium]
MERTACELMRTYLVDVAQKGELGLLDDMAHEDMVDEANAAFGGPPGRAGLRQHVVGFRRHISDLSLEIQRIVGADDAVMAWWSFTGTHVGPWLGRSPSGQPVSATVFSFFELRDARISRYRLWLCAEFPEPVIFDSSNVPPRSLR